MKNMNISVNVFFNRFVAKALLLVVITFIGCQKDEISETSHWSLNEKEFAATDTKWTNIEKVIYGVPEFKALDGKSKSYMMV